MIISKPEKVSEIEGQRGKGGRQKIRRFEGLKAGIRK